MTRSLGFMDSETFQACIRAVKPCQASHRPMGLHHFGESLLHPDLVPYVQYANSQGVPVSLSCNPDWLTPGLGEGLLRAGLARITFSLDGLDDETLQKLRGPSASYPLAEHNILNFLRMRERLGVDCSVRVQMIAFKANQHQWSGFLARWQREDVYAYLKKFDAWTHPELAELGARMMRVTCRAPFESAVVLWDGRVVPCCHDADARVVYGSIRDGLEKIWLGPQASSFRQAFTDNTLPDGHMCRQCSWVPREAA